MMDNEKYLVDANGSYTIKAADNTDHVLCFSDGIISVMDEHGHVICEFHAEDMPAANVEGVVSGTWDEKANYLCWRSGRTSYSL